MSVPGRVGFCGNEKPVCGGSTIGYDARVRWRLIILFLLLTLPVGAAEARREAPSVWDRFQGMLKDVAGELLMLVGQVTGWSVGFALIGLGLGVGGGIFLWRWMRDEKWLDGQFKWGRKIRWVWAVLLVGVLGLGGCSTGMVWGAGTGAKRWVRQGEFFEKTVGHAYAALMIFRAEARLGGKRADELLEKDIAALVRATRGVQAQAAKFEGQFREHLDKWLDDQKISGFKRMMMERAAKFLWDQHVNNPLNDEDAQALVREVLQAGRDEADRKVARDVMTRVANTFRFAAIESINETAWQILFWVMPLTLALAFGPLCLYWIAGCLLRPGD